ncbi:MAG: hypothetical protein K1X65_09625 [Caldilineales bacterium]|nr:hypothetical protein [Caldilineales bacterium]
MYDFLLTLHSLLRWVVVIAAVLAVVRGFLGWSGKRPWSGLDDRLGLIFTISLDVQVLLGLLLYFVLSPITRAALSNLSAAMSNDVTRFFLAEHFPLMLIAVVLAHIGRSRARKAADNQKKFRQTAIWFGIALLLILAAIPWPFLASGAGRGLL